ncbi:hypothetical protein GTU79_20505 [Sodalis ligni]|uniref:hypothetical protein n=1 Tax=Sodalis ligni TaxID=2697027 RepID=UPI00193FB519|nr:hypothetical protein [Sodalis ligni]QWA09692.1 hypothetical protein GTU79_20505 [Sodalis ligni]
MCKIIAPYLLFLFPLMAFASNVVDKEVLQRILNNVSHECLGNPAWPISLPVDNDPWLLGRLEALAESGLVQPAWLDNRPVWLLTPTGAVSSPRSGDGCIGRMLLRHGLQEVPCDR